MFGKFESYKYVMFWTLRPFKIKICQLLHRNNNYSEYLLYDYYELSNTQNSVLR